VQLYLLNGASADKLVVGIPTYGRAFKLVDADQSELGSPAEGPAEAGKATREQGYLAYYEICEKIAKDDWTVDRPDPDAVGPYAWSSSTREWVGYDDEDTVARKANFVNDNQLGGIMFWSIDNDDFRGTCTGRKYPLIEAAKAALLGIPLPEITSQPSTQSNRIGSSSDSSKSTTTSKSVYFNIVSKTQVRFCNLIVTFIY
jgi:chitinase